MMPCLLMNKLGFESRLLERDKKGVLNCLDFLLNTKVYFQFSGLADYQCFELGVNR